MTDYTELVKALRNCGKGRCVDCDRQRQDKCLKRYWNNEDLIDGMLCEAAAAIEELRKVNRELRELYEDAVRKLPNRGEWISVNPMVDSVQCSVCGGQLFSAELETPYCPYCGAEMEVQE